MGHVITLSAAICGQLGRACVSGLAQHQNLAASLLALESVCETSRRQNPGYKINKSSCFGLARIRDKICPPFFSFFFAIQGPNCSLNGVPEAAEADPSDPDLGQLWGETANEP